MVLALVVLAVRASPTWTWVGLLLGVPATILLIIQAVMDSDALFPYSAALEAVLYFYATYGLIRYMLADHVITRDELFAVGATFTLVAWGFAYVFVVWQAIEPGSFTAAVDPEAQRTWMELLFLSFTTLSSTGLSDVVPIDPFARSLVMIEQLVGVAYIAVVVSRLVALTIPRDAMKATIDGGFWAGRRQFNRDVLIPDGERRIREAGTFDNLRAAATGGGTHRGLVYQDSDLHKWVEALGWELRNAPSPALQRMADEVTALLIAAQAPDGYLDTAFQVTGHERYRNLADEHEIYCMGHLIEAGLAHPPLLPVARRVADHLVATFTDRPGCCGHPEAELALVKLYRATGERAYLELARRFVERRGHGTLPQRYGSSAYLVDRVPVREQTVGRGPLRAPAVPQLRRHGRLHRARRAAGPAAGRVGGHGRRQDLHHRRRRVRPGARGVRRAVRARARVRLRRDVRGDRVRVLELAPAAGHGRSALRRPARAHALQRRARRRRVRPLRVQLLEHAPRHPGPAPVVRLRVLPAEPDAAARLAAHLPRDRGRRRADDPPVRDRHGGRRARAHGRTRGRDGSRSTPIARSACASRPGARTRSSTAGRSRPGTSTPTPATTRSISTCA